MTRFLGLLLVAVTLSLGSCQCSNKPDIGPVEEEASAGVIGSDAVDAGEISRSTEDSSAAHLSGRVVVAIVSS